MVQDMEIVSKIKFSTEMASPKTVELCNTIDLYQCVRP